jgi:Glycosyltransferase family 87
VVVLLATVLALALRLYQLTRPGYLLGVTEYDDAVDLGVAVRLVHGVLPYRDFVLVQPPGIALLMAPIALLAKITGMSTGIAVARILTACVGAASVTLAGLLVRHRGVLVTTLTCGLLAVYPASLEAAHTVLLEPWTVLFCLIGALVIFDGDQLTTSTKRLAWGGVAFGFGGAVKVWAVLPVLVILLISWPRLPRRRWLAYAGGVAVGFGVPVLPFFALAPGAFFHSVVSVQLSRIDLGRVREWLRLVSLTGLSDVPSVTRVAALGAAAVIAGFVVLCVVGAWRRTGRPPPDLERFAIGAAAVILAAFLWPADYSPHYAAFFVPFLAMSIALPAGRFVAGPSESGPRTRRSGATLLAGSLTALAVIGLAGMAFIEGRHLTKIAAGNPAAAAQRQIPAGACVVTDLTALTLVSDRFTSSVPGCSPMIDPIGADYDLSGGRNGVSGAARVPAVQRFWANAFRHAQYVWLTCTPAGSPRCQTTNRRIPWTPALLAYFKSHFKAVHHGGLFKREKPRLPT